jgi:hypothetical protein
MRDPGLFLTTLIIVRLVLPLIILLSISTIVNRQDRASNLLR